MKVLLLTRYSRKGASSRLRTLQYVHALTAMGMTIKVSSLLDDAYLEAIYNKRRPSARKLVAAYCRRLRLLQDAADYDLIWFEKELFPDWPAIFETQLVRRNVPYVVDYDDAIFHNYQLSKSPYKRLMHDKIAKVMKNAALVIGGNQYLLEYARNAGAQRTALLPTVIDIRRYLPGIEERTSIFRIGWIGSPNTGKYLQPLLPVLDQLAKQFNFELIVVGASINVGGRNYVHCRPWHEETEADEIARFDVGIMPLPNQPWERGKCGYKLIQYMACAKPVIASPVGVNTELVQEGVNGMLAGDEAAWSHALKSLLLDEGLRRDMGRRGRRLVEEKYCQQVTAPELFKLLESAAGKSGCSENSERRTVEAG